VLGVAVVVAYVWMALVVNCGVYHPPLCSLIGYACPRHQVQGTVEKGWEAVKEHYQRFFDSGNDLGSQLAVYHKGKKVVDLWAGVANVEKEIPFTNETLSVVYSSSKAMTSLVVARLVDQGLLEYNQTVAHYWPEFAAHGKENITVADVMRHSAGLAKINFILTPQLVGDLDALAKALADCPPTFPKNSKRTYHAVTRGFIVNEIVRRVDPKHRTIGKIIEEEIVGPFNEEFYLGNLPPTQLHRLSRIYALPTLAAIVRILLPAYLEGVLPGLTPLPEGEKRALFASMDPESWINQIGKSLPNENIDGLLDPNWAIKDCWRNLELPSANGISKASSIARIAAALANGGELDGIRLISPKGLAKALSEPVTEEDALFVTNTSIVAAGWGEAHLFGIAPGFYGWGGWGGSAFVFDPKLNLGFSYVMNGQQGIVSFPVAGPLSHTAQKCALENVHRA
jgi:CubicO group peptidase (beta-lactamase class C family)